MYVGPTPYGGTRPQQPKKPGYRGGSFGMESDFGIRDTGFQAAIDAFNRRNQAEWDSSSRMSEINAQGDNQIRGIAAGLTTEANKGIARGDLQRSLQDWGTLRDTGGMTDDEFTRQSVARQNRVQIAADAAKKNFNSTMAARGLGGNAGAVAALGMTGDFAAAGELGQAEAELQAERRAAKERGIAGYSGVSDRLSQIALTPTQEAALRLTGGGGGGGLGGGTSSGGWSGGGGDPSQIMDLARQWMDFDIGPGGGYDWDAQERPVRPDYDRQPAPPDPWDLGFRDRQRQRPNRNPRGRSW